MADAVLFDNELFGSDDNEQQLSTLPDEPIKQHPHVLTLQQRIKEVEYELEHHKILCRQLQDMALRTIDQRQDPTTSAEDRQKKRKCPNCKGEESAQDEDEEPAKSKHTKQAKPPSKVDAYVNEMIQDPGLAVEIKENVMLPWGSKPPPKAFVKAYLRARYHLSA